MSDFDDDGVGYGKPPVSTRFQKGVSGNPSGRKPGKHREAPYEAILGQIVTITENGRETQMTAEEAFLRKLLNDGAKGDSSAAIQILDVLEEEARRRELADRQKQSRDFCVRPIPNGSVAHHLTALKILRKFDRFRDTAYFRIEPKAIEDALGRFCDRRLSVEEQRIVFNAARTPHKVNWPDWWEVFD